MSRLTKLSNQQQKWSYYARLKHTVILSNWGIYGRTAAYTATDLTMVLKCLD